MIHPKVAAYAHLAMAIFWVIMIPVSLLTGLKESVPFLVLISILALVFSELAGFQSALAERRLDDDDEYGS